LNLGEIAAVDSIRLGISVISSSKLIKNAGYWHRRAEEVRAQASAMRDPAAQRYMRGIAEDYDRLARRAKNLQNPR
jgi:hypothetical protein